MMISPLSIKHINHITSDRYMYIKILGFFNNGMGKTPYYINQNNGKHKKNYLYVIIKEELIIDLFNQIKKNQGHMTVFSLLDISHQHNYFASSYIYHR